MAELTACSRRAGTGLARGDARAASRARDLVARFGRASPESNSQGLLEIWPAERGPRHFTVVRDRATQPFCASRSFPAEPRAARTINRPLCAVGVQPALSAVLACGDNTTTSTQAAAGASGAIAGTDTSSGAGSVSGGVAGRVFTGAGAGAAGSGGVGGAAGHAGAAGNGGGGAGSAGSSIPSPARLLCIGDSITEAESSWIFPLQDALREAGCEVTLIGYEEGPYNGPYAPRAGYEHRRIAAGGFTTGNILPVIDDAIDDVVQAQHQPDSEVMAVAPALNVETSDSLHPTAAGSVTLARPISIKLVEVLKAAGACSP